MVRYRHSEQVYNVPGSSEDALGLEFGDLALEMLVGLKIKKVIIKNIVHLKIIFYLNFLRSGSFRIFASTLPKSSEETKNIWKTVNTVIVQVF